MSGRGATRGAIVGAAVLLCLTTAGRTVRAENSNTATCLAAHHDAQRLRRDKKLIEARARLVLCAGESCPGLVEKDCSKWLDQVSRAIPSVVISAKDEGGRELTDVTLGVEGHFSHRAVDGSPIELDPGAYHFVYERPGGIRVERNVVLQQGVRNRLVEVTFPGGKSVHEKPPPPPIAYVLAGVGVVGLGSFTYFGLKGRSEYLELKHSCAPSCKPNAGDSARSHFLIANVSLGVAAVSLAASTYFFLWWPSSHEKVVRTRGTAAFITASPLGGGFTTRF